MPNSHETKPHVLTIAVDDRCDGCKGDDPEEHCEPRCLRYAVDCPYTEQERPGVCEMWFECDCSPVMPPWDEPARARGSLFAGMGGTGYAFGQNIIAVAAWSAYWQHVDEHEEEHPGGWEPTGRCWVAEGDHDWPEPLDDVPYEPGVYRVSVDNAGSLDDSVLVLYLWPEEVTDGEPTDTAQEQLVTA